jgi:putative nucleotidyltransferase with HDIG domain
VPYLFPLAAYSLLISSQFGVRQSIITTMALAVLVTYGLPYSTELTLYYLLGSLFGVLVLDRGKRVSSFFWAGLAIAASGTLVAVGYRLPRPETDWMGIATIAGAALANGIASTSIALLVQHFLAQLMGNVTALQLYELSRPDHTLLKQLLQKAPGTYQHSLQVANMVEQAAEEIGADALLARVGALYHDIGKVENPAYFIENQVIGSVNPHDLIPAQESASIIIRHVDDGLSLAKKHRVPARIRDFIAEHHGASITRYQYNRAQQESNGDGESIQEKDYQYPGPHPHTRETALLMLADGTEARVRAEHPQNEEELRALVKSVITQRLTSGYLQNSDLTLKDLTKIEISFTDSLRGIYHPRLKYPSQPETQADTHSDREITRPAASLKPEPPLLDEPKITNLLQSENDPH